MTARHKLEERLDSTAASPLAGDLRALAGADLVLDASGVTHLGTPGVQVLLSAAASWRASGAMLTVEAPSEAFGEQLAALGLTLRDISTGDIPAGQET